MSLCTAATRPAAGNKLTPINGRGGYTADSYSIATNTLPTGFYLVEVAWHEGVGSYAGTASLTPTRRR